MKSLRKILTFALLLVASGAMAQFIEVDWETMARDTLLPRYSTMIELPDDYAIYDYEATIEYPEFVPMSPAEPPAPRQSPHPRSRHECRFW